MVKFTAAIGANRCQTFADEARSEGYVGVEGDDPSIYWTYKQRDGYGPNDGKTAGVYAIDEETVESISTQHPAVLFNDRVHLPPHLPWYALPISPPLVTRGRSPLLTSTAETRTAGATAPPPLPHRRPPHKPAAPWCACTLLAFSRMCGPSLAFSRPLSPSLGLQLLRCRASGGGAVKARGATHRAAGADCRGDEHLWRRVRDGGAAAPVAKRHHLGRALPEIPHECCSRLSPQPVLQPSEPTAGAAAV